MLLKKSTRRKYFKELGLGEYNKENILKLQKKYFTNKAEHDGKYGRNTDILLRHVRNVEKNCKNFSPEEFKCGCGGRYCTGYPTYLRAKECRHIQSIRDLYKRPMQITSGLRCRGYNTRLSGSSSNSRHMTGKAVDFYMAGVTDSLNGRKRLIDTIKHLPNHNWSYCNGYCSKGYAVHAPNMGNAVHTDVR